MYPHSVFPLALFPGPLYPGPGAILVVADWDGRPLADDSDPFGIDPEQTISID